MTPLTWAVDALIAASLADVVTTRAGLRTGLVHEANPLMRWWTRTTLRAMTAKTLALAAVSVELLRLRAEHPVLAVAIAWAGAGWTLRTAWQNYRLLRTLQAADTFVLPRR